MKARTVYFLFGWVSILSILSLVLHSEEILLMFLILAGFLFVVALSTGRKKPIAPQAAQRVTRIQKLSSKAVHANPNANGRLAVHR